jgi:very-short-patch-repair endonuclease
MEFFEYESIKDRVRRLRKEMTDSEKRIWTLLKGKQVMGFKFRRQHPITVDHDLRGHRTYFIIDFYCPELKLGIEIDGPIHDTQKHYDQLRDFLLSEKGISIYRLTNDEVSRLYEADQTIRVVVMNRHLEVSCKEWDIPWDVDKPVTEK